MARDLTRRHLMTGALSGAVTAAAGRMASAVAEIVGNDAQGAVQLGPAQPFSFEALKEQARDAADKRWVRNAPLDAAVLQKIDYDAYQQIRYRADHSLQLDKDRRTPVQLFHLGKYFMEPASIHLVAGGVAREVTYSSQLFEMPVAHVARRLPDGIGFAGFRVMAPDLKTDWLSFLGASYFRSSGPFNQYGISARGVAIDTAMPQPEEFPRFTAFWLEGAPDNATALTIHALLEGPSIAGAYRMRTERYADARGISRCVMEIECELNARKHIRRLGVAPFSSMHWYGKYNRPRVADWRPEIHDSDGLAIWTGAGERIWRPLNNPPRVTTSVFVDHDVKGFGLLQRNRDFAHYLDDGVFYERRPSVWVEPLDGWGRGAVQLVEIPTDDEAHDNIVAYWSPDGPFAAGESRRYRYRLSWVDDISFPDNLGRATGTWIGVGGRPGHKRPKGARKFVVDWQGAVFEGLGRHEGVEVVVTASRGTVSNVDTHPVVDQRGRWRSLFDVRAPGSEPVDMRAYLRVKDRALSETWLFQWLPEAED